MVYAEEYLEMNREGTSAAFVEVVVLLWFILLESGGFAIQSACLKRCLFKVS